MEQIQEITVSNNKLVKLLDYEYSEEPLWGDDAGRVAEDGHFSGTFKGYFPQLVLNFDSMTKSEMAYNNNLLAHPIINVGFEKNTGVYAYMDFYGTAIKTKIENNKNGYKSGFSITLTGCDAL